MEPPQLEHESAELSGPSHLRLGEILIRRGHITQDDLGLALGLQGLDGNDGRLGRILVELGAITEETLISALGEQSGLPVVDLDAVAPDAMLLEGFSREAALRFGALPLRRCDQAILVAVTEPPTREFRRALSRQLRARVEFALAVPDALCTAIGRAFPPGATLASRARVSQRSDESTGVDTERVGPGAGFRATEPDPPSTPVADSIVEWLIGRARDAGATALHLVAEADVMHLRVRVDGAMHDEVDLPEPAGSMLLERIATAAALSVDAQTIQRGTLWSGDTTFGPELAVASAPTVSGRYLVIHPLRYPPPPVDQGVPELSQARHALATLMSATDRGVVLFACTDQARRRAILRDLATDPIMRTHSVCCAGLGTERALPGVNQLELVTEPDRATLAHMARDFDHDIVVLDVDDNDDMLRVGFDVGLGFALVIAGVPDQSAVDAVTHSCNSLNPLLVASGLALVIDIADNGTTHIVANGPALKTAILDSPTTDELTTAIRAHQSRPAGSPQ